MDMSISKSRLSADRPETDSARQRRSVIQAPIEWALVPLGDVCSFANGVNAEKRAYGQGTPFINVLEVITHTHLRANDIPGRVGLNKPVLEAFTVRRGDVLFNRTSETQEEVGLSAVYDDDVNVVFGGFVIRGRFLDDSFDPTYVGYGFRAPAVRRQIVAQGQGAIRANIGQSNLKRVLIPIPSKREQRAIAEALSDVDGLLDSLEALIAKKRAIKQAAMQQLLTGKTRLPGFRGEWETKRLGELAEMASGATPKSTVSAYYGGDIPWVSIADMTQSGKIIMRTERNLTQLGFATSAARMYPIRTVLYAMYASLGECSIAGIELCSSQAILGIRPGRNLNAEFLYYWLNGFKETAKELGQQGTQANLNKGLVEGFHIPLPSLEEQTAIATILSDMDAEITALEARRDKTRAIKQGMMQQLLTGRVRLIKNEVSN